MAYGGCDGKDGTLLRCSLVQRRDNYRTPPPLESALTNKAPRVNATNHTVSFDLQRHDIVSYHMGGKSYRVLTDHVMPSEQKVARSEASRR